MRRLLLASTLILSGLAATGHSQSNASPSIEGRWTVTTTHMVGSFPTDLVVSVDRDRIYGMIGDLQIRGTISEGKFSFEASRMTFDGTVQADGTLAGNAIRRLETPYRDGNTVIAARGTTWTAKRAGARVLTATNR